MTKQGAALAVLAACFLTGCGANRYAEKFSETSDAFKIEAAVYGYMLQRHFWDSSEYSAVFLKGSDDEVAVLIRQFHDHVPPIKPSHRAELHPNRTPLDRDTGRPAMIFSTEVLEPAGNEVEAIGIWYGGPAVTGRYTFLLIKMDGEWRIQTVK